MPFSLQNNGAPDTEALINILKKYIEIKPAEKPFLVKGGVKIIL